METKKFTQPGTISLIVMLPIFIFSVIMLIYFGLTDFPEGAVFGFLAAIFLICLLIFYKLTITIDDTMLTFSMGVGFVSKKYLIADIKSCKVVKNSAFNGIGIKLLNNGWLYNVSGLYAVELTFKNRKSVVRIGTDKPEEIAGIINKMINNEQREAFSEFNDYSGYWFGAVILILALLLPFLLIFTGKKEPVVKLTATSIEIKGIYGLTLKYSDITSIDTVSQMPRVRLRTNGYAFAKTLKGNFRLQGQVKAKLFIREGSPPYIHITTNEINLYINFRDPDKTLKLFNDIGSTPMLNVSENKRYLVTEKGDPFFWLGDTGWLLFSKLNRQETEKYFEDRKQKGFNVIQVMVLHSVINEVNIYGDSALINHRVDLPLITPGNSPDIADQYDYWDHVDWMVNLARQKGLYLGLVPVWGSNVKGGQVTREQAAKYAAWLSERYKDQPNIIWINGGDINGSDSTAIWNIIGSTIRQTSPQQLITFHPFGRTQSSTWFHNEPWLNFNMFQSGHRRYDQDTAGLHYGEDNWKYATADYNKVPVKPTLDGEPSYEGIPQGLHDTLQPYWTDSDVRRYAYWSVFAGGCGFTYGNNAVMQFHKPGDNPAYGSKEFWDVALNDPGAGEVQFLKELMLSRPYLERVPAGELISGTQGEKYDYLAATRGKDYAFIYTYNGSTMRINTGILGGELTGSWYNPRTGKYSDTFTIPDKEVREFDPPGDKINGNDWVLVLDRKKSSILK
jgi:hypothetical protein